MVVCKFFLQGNCRYGNSCKFEHQIGDNNQSYTSVLRQQNVAQPTNPAEDKNVLIKSVSNDMQTAEKGGLWLFSCYGPFKEKTNFPGFEDNSFEEIRFGFHEATKNGTVDQYKQQLQMLARDNMMKIKALQNPSPDLINIICNIYNSSNPGVQNNSNVFGKVQQQQLQQQPQQQSIFSQTNQNFSNVSNFQQQNSAFGSTFGQNIFGNKPNVNIGGSNFNNQNYSPLANASPFTPAPQTISTPPQQPAPPDNSFSVFGSNPNNVQPNVFQNQNIFGVQPQNTPPQSFQTANVNQNSVFGGQMTQNPVSPFTASAAHVSVPQSAPGNFGVNQAQNFNSSTHSSSIFGSNFGSSNQNKNIGVSVNVKEERFYSKIEDLTEEDKKMFENPEFMFGKIPEKPPPVNLCF